MHDPSKVRHLFFNMDSAMRVAVIVVATMQLTKEKSKKKKQSGYDFDYSLDCAFLHIFK